MKKRYTKYLSLFILLFTLLLSGCSSSFRPYIKAGSLNVINWGISKEAFVARLGSLKKKPVVTEDTVIYRIRYIHNYGYGVRIPTKLETFKYYFNEKNQLYKVSISYYGTFNRIAIRAVVEREIDIARKYKKLLGKPDEERPRTFVFKKRRYPMGVVLWRARKGRRLKPNTEVKLYTLGRKKGVIFIETYVNTQLKPKAEADADSDKENR